jgi:hypothetical protein
MQKVIGKIFFDIISLVSQADNEIIDAIMRIDLHDMPENGLAADLDHGFGPKVGFFADAGSETTGKYDCFHGGFLIAFIFWPLSWFTKTFGA